MEGNGIEKTVDIFNQAKFAKRPEQQKKFIYTWVLKAMKKKLQELSFSPFKMQQNPDEFLEKYYNKENQSANKLSHIQLKSPFRINAQKNFKTLNDSFLNHVFTNEKFKNDFSLFLKNKDFIDLYKQQRVKKVKRLFDKVTLIDQVKANNSDEALNDFFLKNNKLKLPWSDLQIQEAVKFFERRIDQKFNPILTRKKRIKKPKQID